MVDSMDVVADPDDPSRHTARLRMTISADDPHNPPAQEGPRHAEHV